MAPQWPASVLVTASRHGLVSSRPVPARTRSAPSRRPNTLSGVRVGIAPGRSIAVPQWLPAIAVNAGVYALREAQLQSIENLSGIDRLAGLHARDEAIQW